MITEDYVSFETAKLLKEKGFDWECFQYWHEDDNKLIHSQSMHPIQNVSNPCFFGPAAPTLQMAMKWLREAHNLVIEPYRTACGYLYTISNIPYGSTKYDNSQAFNGDDEDSGQWTTWERACEDGIKYCLENLI